MSVISSLKHHTMHNTFTLHKQPYHFYHAGHSGPFLLMVHGFPLSHLQWQPQIDYFQKQCRVVVPDLRGLGQSNAGSNQHLTITMDDHADDLIALLDHLKITEPVILMGLSMGGYITWQMLRKYASRIKALVLCHTRVVADTPEQAQARIRLAADTCQQQTAQLVEDVMFPRILPPHAPAALVDKLREMSRATTPEGLAANLRGLATRQPADDILAQIAVPTLVISGEYDAISTPQEMQAWATKISDHRFIAILGVGHLSPMEVPDIFNQHLLESLPWLTGPKNC